MSDITFINILAENIEILALWRMTRSKGIR